MREDSTNQVNWVGMDVHADSIQVAMYRGWDPTPWKEREFQTDRKGLDRLLRQLQEAGGPVRCVYEAGPCGYELQRFLEGNGVRCEVAAPSLIPRKAGDRVKTDRRDARNLGRLHRAGELTTVQVPDEEQEAVRDLERAREDAVEDLRRARHRMEKFLLRHGFRYRDGRQWTQAHGRWMKGIRFEDARLEAVREECLLAVEEASERLKRLTRAVEAVAQEPRYQKPAAALMTLRGVGTLTAVTILAEMGDMRRYGTAKEFMSALGLVPSEHSSGGKTFRGSITKTGNVHARRVLVEAAWQYQRRPAPGGAVKRRREGQPLETVRVAQKAEERLRRKFRRLVARGKRTTVAAVAVARELAGFVWAVAQTAQA